MTLLPERAALLADAFPVLRQIAAIAEAPRPPDVHDPVEKRARVFAALRELFARLALRRSLLLTIDDFQWTDSDSQVLLAELLRPPEAPPLLLVTTTRHLGAEPPSPPGDVRDLQVRASIGPRSLELVRDAALTRPRQPLERGCRPRAVSTQPLERVTIVASDDDAGVQRETLAPRAQALGAAHNRLGFRR